MKIYRNQSVPGFCLLLALIVASPSDLFGQGSGFYLRAPDVIPETLPEMRAPAYWIETMHSPDEVVLSYGQIDEMNREYQERIRTLTEMDDDTGQRIRQQLGGTPGLISYMPDIHELSGEERSGIVRDILERQIQTMRRRSFGNILGIEYADHELDDLEEEMSLDSVPGQIDPEPGLTVTDTRLRIIPALRPEYIGLTQVGKTRWDVWNLDVLPMATPVQILHVSESGGHLLILSEYGYGWVPSQQIALASQNEIDNFIESEEFLVSMADRVPFYSSADVSYVSGWMRLGARLPLVDPENTALVQVPVRKTSGELVIEQAWLKPDSHVHVGYVPYTRRNVIDMGFTMLDNIYDWTGGWYGRNDGTVLRDIFKTFGFRMPANGVLLSLFSEDNRVVSSEGTTDDRHDEIVTTAEPFLTFMVSRSGHSLLYIGEFNDIPVVFDTHGYGYEDDDQEIEIRRWSIATLSVPDYLLRQDVTITPIH